MNVTWKKCIQYFNGFYMKLYYSLTKTIDSSLNIEGEGYWLLMFFPKIHHNCCSCSGQFKCSTPLECSLWCSVTTFALWIWALSSWKMSLSSGNSFMNRKLTFFKTLTRTLQSFSYRLNFFFSVLFREGHFFMSFFSSSREFFSI